MSTTKTTTKRKPNTTTSNIAELGESTGVKLAKKLFQAKKEITPLAESQTNPFYNSKYFDINDLLRHVEPILHNNGLMILQPISNGKITTKIIDVDTGASVRSSIDMPPITDPQKMGSAITYLRRYTLQSLLGLQAEDDDANATKQKPQPIDPKPIEIPTLNAEQFKLAMESDAKGVWATIKAIADGKIKASTNQINKLKVQHEKLTQNG
jgi:hypothetical protein